MICSNIFSRWQFRTESDFKKISRWHFRMESDFEKISRWHFRTERDFEKFSRWHFHMERDFEKISRWQSRTELVIQPDNETNGSIHISIDTLSKVSGEIFLRFFCTFSCSFEKCPYFCAALVRRDDGAIAQLVEQRTENPCVPGSIPGGTTSKISIPYIKRGVLIFFLLHGYFFRQIITHIFAPRVPVGHGKTHEITINNR